MKNFCGNIRQRVNNCTEVPQESCNKKAGFWMVDGSTPRKCSVWNPSIEKCFYGDPCKCRKQAFTLDKIGIAKGSPYHCEDLNNDQCQYFGTSDFRRCVPNFAPGPGKYCEKPPDTDPICEDETETNVFAVYSDNCPFGSEDKCPEICKNKDKSFTGPAQEILRYGCDGHGFGTYCMCSKK